MDLDELTLKITPHKTSHNNQGPATGWVEASAQPPHDLLSWGMLYLKEEVLGVQAHNTFMAKRRDLQTFLTWYYEHNGHLAAEAWAPRDTAAFCAHLEEDLGRAPTTINRALATLRRFARFIHDRHRSPFQTGLPTRGVKPLVVHQPAAQKLTGQQLHLLTKAADALVSTETRANARPRRNRAALALLLHTGLRVSELCALDLDQYQGKHLLRVVRKGRTRADLFVAKAARLALDEYLRVERPLDDDATRAPLLLTSRGRRMNRRYVGRALARISEEACKHHPEDGRFSVHPHQLRHTFASLLHARTGSDARTAELLGHSSTKYIARYTRPTEQENQALLEDLLP